MSKEFQENVSNQLQLGALDKDLVLLFRKQTEERKFKKVDVLRIMTNWWLDMDIPDQRDLYHGIGIKQPENEESSINKCIETVRDVATRYKIPDKEQQRLIDSLRKALGPGIDYDINDPDAVIAHLDADVRHQAKNVDKKRSEA